MAATVTDSKVSVNVILDGGNGKTISIPLGSLDKDAFNVDKVMGIVALLTPCLDKTVLRTEKVLVSTLAAGD